MDSGTPPKTPGPSSGQSDPQAKTIHKPDNSHQEVVGLMKKMGSRAGYNGIPPTQHAWQEVKGNPPLHRAWSWMCNHTIAWGHRCEYAVSKGGEELYIDHLANEVFGGDRGNAYKAWSRGVELGLWRNGTKKEGTRRLYLCGHVLKPAEISEENGKERVCTDNLPKSVLNKIKQLPQADQDRFWQNRPMRVETRKTAFNEGVAALRNVLDRDEDAELQEYGVSRGRQDHESSTMTPEQIEARRERVKALIPTIEKHVQTVQSYVHSTDNSAYTQPAQSKNGGATLLPVETPRENLDTRAVRQVLTGSPSSNNPISVDGKKSHKQLPALQIDPIDESKWPEEVAKVFAAAERWRRQFPVWFGDEEFTPENKGHLQTMLRIVQIVDGDVEVFISFAGGRLGKIHDKGIALAKHPGKASVHGRGLGMVLEWAGDFRRNAPARATRNEDMKRAIAQSAERQQERYRRNKAEAEAAEARHAHLVEHPEDCERCQGSGVQSVRADGFKVCCGCPAGERLQAARGASL